MDPGSQTGPAMPGAKASGLPIPAPDCAIFTARTIGSSWPPRPAAAWRRASTFRIAPKPELLELVMAGEAKIRTVIADDEAPARARIRQLLKAEPDFEIIAECANGRQTVELIQ